MQPDPAMRLVAGVLATALLPHHAPASEAERLAGLLADAPSEGAGALAPPAFICEPELAPALAVWRELAPTLAERGSLDTVDRGMFALLCYYRAEFIAAAADLMDRGYWLLVKTVSGDRMPRTNPSVKRRDDAVAAMMELSKRFGLTPLDRHTLFRARRSSLWQEDPLFGEGAGAARPAAAPVAPSSPPPPGDGWSSLLDQPAKLH